MSEKWVDKDFWSPSTGEEGDFPSINCGKFEHAKVIHLEQCLYEIIVMKKRCIYDIHLNRGNETRISFEIIAVISGGSTLIF